MLCLPFDGSRLILESYFLFLGGRCHSWIRGRNPLLGHSPRIGPIVSAVRFGSRRSLLLFALSDRLLHFRVFLHAQLAMLWRRRRLLVPTICPPRALLLDCPCLLTLSSAFSWSCAVPLPVAMLFLRIQMRSFDPCVLSCPAGRSMPSMDSRSQSSARALAEYRTHRFRGPMWESAQPARFHIYQSGRVLLGRRSDGVLPSACICLDDRPGVERLPLGVCRTCASPWSNRSAHPQRLLQVRRWQRPGAIPPHPCIGKVGTDRPLLHSRR